jgi:hypothetical protein
LTGRDLGRKIWEVPTSKRRKKPTTRRQGGRTPPGGLGPSIPPIDGLIRTVLRGGRELLDIDDPFEAERWGSAILGTFYKLPLPLQARDELERSLGPAIVQGAEGRGDAGGLAILRALAVVGGDAMESTASEAAERLVRSGVPEPVWAPQIGRPDFVDAWVLEDPYGDQLAYYSTFRYPGREPHTLMALYDENIGGIIKDAFAAYVAPNQDPRRRAEQELGAIVKDADPGVMAARVRQAVASGDLYLDNDWTPEFKETRALLLSRMRSLPAALLPEPQPPLDNEARAALTSEFLASPHAPAFEDAAAIVGHCLDARCDYGDGDALRWSPIVVELFMLDYLPRRAFLDAGQIRILPQVLRGWVRFALMKLGLDERWIAEAEDAVQRFTPEFRRAVTDHSSFGPAKAIANAMLASGVDLRDQRAVDWWIEDFNRRPIEERDAVLGTLHLPGEP